MKLNNVSIAVVVAIMCAGIGGGAWAAKKTSAAAQAKQSAIQKGTTVRTRVEAKGIYDQECYDAYYGCMDQFCITDNSNGGSCACSNEGEKLEKQLLEIQDLLTEADRIRTIEVEKVKAGSQADIIFTGTRQYDENGNIISVDDLAAAEAKAKSKRDLMSVFNSTLYDDEDDDVDITDKHGADLFVTAEEICVEQIPDKCEKDLKFFHQLYVRQIASDCKGFENTLNEKRALANQELESAKGEVRTALKESFDSANKYDLGQCMVEFKKCMLTDDACGSDWSNCVSAIASENMQNTTKKVAVKKSATDIADSTMEILNAKRTICEHVLNECVVVRNEVWPAFLREVAPTIKVAESQVESRFRQSCLTNISKCIQTACKDDIVGKGVDTMDACLARPDMARSFCKVEIDPCERMEPQIWGYVKDKLAAMRVDACTQEVKDCFTNENRCGENFANCIGMDYNYIHDICPVDSLVVCKQANPDFTMDDLDSMLMGLYLNIDNSALEQCQQLVDKKMAEVCGSTTDCNKFAADDTIGTGSLHSQKDGSIYRVTGMISFGSIKMGDASGLTKDKGDDKTDILGPGEIGVQEYLSQVRSRNANVQNSSAIISSIEEELNNIAGTINRTIEMIEQDPEIQFCVKGRDLSQITGKKNAKTAGRFPNLLNQVKMQIAVSALRQAQDNYNAKLNKAIADATKNASADVAQYMCQMLPYTGGVPSGILEQDTPLSTPYAISYDVGVGLDTSKLTSRAGKSSTDLASGKVETIKNENKGARVVAAVLTLGISEIARSAHGGADKVVMDNGRGKREMWATFDRDNRVCHFCTATTSQQCSTQHKQGFLGIGASDTVDCGEANTKENCQDIQM